MGDADHGRRDVVSAGDIVIVSGAGFAEAGYAVTRGLISRTSITAGCRTTAMPMPTP